ncbi:SDR family oxidoreductase [Leptospira venezuelensis]|uniref:SDR family oxidoreductase n=1 Tax=Leptospira venezuelensis TaxID=1958811 RepID=UPI000A3B9FBB|nr:SDR family oxidoreductase [Leptospira venezuelensis]
MISFSNENSYSFFKDKVVWITGASSGIGEALAAELKGTGAKLILSARRTQELLRVRDAQGWKEEDSMILPLDLENYDSLKQFPEEVIRKFGKIDVLINNGGISQRSLAHETLISTYRSLMNINFFGNIAITLATLPYFRKEKKGYIVSISSIAGKFGVPFRTGYSASKFALSGFYEGLRAENSGDNLKVLLVYPGFIKTKISENAFSGDGSKHGILDPGIQRGIEVEECAKRILDAIVSGEQEIIIASIKERFGIFLHKFFPKFFSLFLTRARVI